MNWYKMSRPSGRLFLFLGVYIVSHNSNTELVFTALCGGLFLCPFSVLFLSASSPGSGLFLWENTHEVMMMQGNPYQMYQPMYGNPYAARMQQNPVPYYQPQPQQTPGVVASMVTNQKEAEAAQILFNNDVNVFVDAGGAVIYTKRFNPQTGAADFAVYRREDAAQEPPATAYASQADVDAIRQQLAEVVERLDRGRRARKDDDA